MEHVFCLPPSNKPKQLIVCPPPPSYKPKQLIVCPPPPSYKLMGRGVCLSLRSFILSKATDPILPFVSTVESAEKVNRAGVIGDRRLKRMVIGGGDVRGLIAKTGWAVQSRVLR
jgi:hypothetical protein